MLDQGVMCHAIEDSECVLRAALRSDILVDARNVAIIEAEERQRAEAQLQDHVRSLQVRPVQMFC